jgi:hypothetical protein
MLPAYLQEVYRITDVARAFGYRALPNGTELVGHVPHIASEAWFHQRFTPLSEPDTMALEARLGRELPPVLRTFYSHYNGLGLFAYELLLHGLRYTYERTGDAAWQPFDLAHFNQYDGSRRKHRSAQQLLLSRYRSDGAWLYLDTTTGNVYRENALSSQPEHEWPSFEVMLVAEAQRLALLFDEQGRRYEHYSS